MSANVRGDGLVELEMFGDFECPYCRDAAPAVARAVAALGGRARLRFRHFPLEDRHPHARHAAEAAEAAAEQGRFWELHDLLYAHQDALEDDDLVRWAGEAGVDGAVVAEALRDGRFAPIVDADRTEGIERGVTGTPAFFIAGERYQGFYDEEALVDALEDAGA